MTELVSSVGYRHLTTSQLATRAGLSVDEFEGLFTDKQECFSAAFTTAESGLIRGVENAAPRSRPDRSGHAVVRAMASHAQRIPTAARLLLWEPLQGGEAMRTERQRLLAALAATLDGARASAKTRADLPASLICGTTARLLARRLRQGLDTSDVADRVLAWLTLYECEVPECRWEALRPRGELERSPFLSATALGPQPARATSVAAAPGLEVSEDDWVRIVFATAESVQDQGFDAATIEDVALAAGVSVETFRAAFDDVEAALAAAQEMLFRHLMAVTAGAFASAEGWESRLWEALRALTQEADQNPVLTRVALLEPCTPARVNGALPQDVGLAFTMFLRQHEGNEPEVPDGAFEAIVSAITELAVQQLQDRPGEPLASLFPQIVFLCMAPFVGRENAEALALLRSSPVSAAAARAN